MRQIQIADLKGLLIERIDQLVRELAPDGVRRGVEWVPLNPARGDRRRGSFVIRVAGAKVGSFVEYAEADMKGDVIDLIAYLVAGARRMPPSKGERIQAMAWARNWLGIERMSRTDVVRARRASEARVAESKAREEIEALRRRDRARQIFLEAQPIEGTLADVYLATRGIELKRIRHREASLRFAHRLRHWLEPWTGPAMVAIFRNAKGSPTAIHCTWLRDDGKGKAPDLEKPKMMLGHVQGSVIRLSKGETGLTPEEHEAARARPGCLCATEGIEDGLTVAMACPEFRVWAAGSLGNLQNMPGLPCISDWLLCQDNDWDKPKARAMFRNAVRTLEGLRLGPVGVARSWVGKDMNDLLRAS